MSTEQTCGITPLNPLARCGPCVLPLAHSEEDHIDAAGQRWARPPVGHVAAPGQPARWLDTGSGPGVMVPVRVAVRQGSALAAYRTLLDHLMTCPECSDPTGCPEAQELRAAYRQLRD